MPIHTMPSWQGLMYRLVLGTVALLTNHVAWGEESQEQEKVPLNIEIPPRVFGGLPYDGWADNLESGENFFKSRPPFMVPVGTTLISRGKPVSSSDPNPVQGTLQQLTDGEKYSSPENSVFLRKGVQSIQIDLEARTPIYAIVLWHFYQGSMFYRDVAVQVSNDPEFKEGVTTLFNNDVDNSSRLGTGSDYYYFEKAEGRLIDGRGIPARYVRFYSAGNTNDELNKYVEAEVFGTPPAEQP